MAINKFIPGLLLAAICLLGCVAAHAEIHQVQVDPFGFYPDEITIIDGDTIDFSNFTGANPLTIHHSSGPCTGWFISIPNYGTTPVQFNCGEGTENYADGTFGFTGIIHILPTPAPTATPDPNIPATGGGGNALILLLFTMLLAAPVFRR